MLGRHKYCQAYLEVHQNMDAEVRVFMCPHVQVWVPEGSGSWE